MLIDYILERCEQLRKETQPRLKGSLIQPGEYFIEVTRLYGNDGTSFLSPTRLVAYPQGASYSLETNERG